MNPQSQMNGRNSCQNLFLLLILRNGQTLCLVHIYLDSISWFAPFLRQNGCYSESVLEFILFPTYQILSLLRTIVSDLRA